MSRFSLSNFILRCLSMLLLWISLPQSAEAVTPDILKVDISSSTDKLSIRDWQEAKIRLRYNCSSTTTNATNATIVLVLPAEMEAVSLTGSIHTTGTNYITALRTATFTFVNPLPAGSTGDVFLNVRFLQTTPENTKAKISALFASTNSLPKVSDKIEITGINAPVASTYTFVKGMKVAKTANSGTLDANYGYTVWYITHGNTGATGQNVPNYTVEDVFPVGTMLTEFSNEKWSGTSNNVFVYYKTNKNSTYRQWGSSALYKTGDSHNWFYPSALGLATGEYVTALKWTYGTLTGGGVFHPDAMDRPLSVTTRVVDPANAAFGAGKTIQNCATVTGTSETTKSSCATQTMDTPAPSFGFWHYISAPGSTPYMAGSKVQYTIAFGINAQSSTAVTNPSLGVLLPKELSYSANTVVSGEAFTDAGSPAPKFFQTPNWKGTGRTLLRWSWSAATGNAFTIPYQRNWRNVYIQFDATIASSTTDGYYRSTAYGNWNPNGKGGNWFEQDVEDWDSNSNTTEMRARHDMDLNIAGLAPRYAVGHWVNGSSPFEMNEAISYTNVLRVNPDSAAPLKDPVIAVLLPKEIEYVGNPVITSYQFDLTTQPVAKFTRVDNFEGTGQTLVRWSWTTAGGNSMTIPATGLQRDVVINFDARVRNFTPNGNYRTRALFNWSPNGAGYWWMETDTSDFDGNGNTTEKRAIAESWTQALTAGGSAGFNSEMLVKGELDTNWTAFPAQGLTTPGGKADYKLTLTNPSGVIMRNLVLIDILPNLGDKGVIDLSARGSQWSPYLAAPVAASGATVSYSLSGNPCRDELTPGIPVGCEAPNWTVTPPADITKVKSLKIDFGATKINPGDNLVIQWPMRAPINAPTAGEVAWNSFGYVAVRDDDGTSLLASEPIKTGISIKPPDPPFYGDYVWNDLNHNGIQEAGEPGVNGVRVELYRDNGDKINNPASDTFVGFTTTAYNGYNDGAYRFGNMGVGDYYAIVVAPPDWGISPKDQGTADDVDSDGEPILYQGGRAGLMPITTLIALEDDKTWDQGIYDRSGTPSVWAMVAMENGQSVLGGRFQTSHGLARRNIVRVNQDGSVDTSFTPGSGFNGEVRALAINKAGQILAGGTFTTYNGKAAFGVALLSSNGATSTSLTAPDVNNVRWVGVASEGLYAAGAFSSVGGTPRRGIVRYTAAGALDASFDSSNGANGVVNAGAVQADGKLIIAGNFTSYNGTSRARIARLNTNGSLDASFNPASGANGEIFSLKMIEDGRIVLTGSFTAFNNIACNGTMRLMPDGSPDPTITPSSLTVNSIQTTN